MQIQIWIKYYLLTGFKILSSNNLTKAQHHKQLRELLLSAWIDNNLINSDFHRLRTLIHRSHTGSQMYTHPFCLHAIPLLIRARRNSISTCSGLLLEVVETLHSPCNQRNCECTHLKLEINMQASSGPRAIFPNQKLRTPSFSFHGLCPLACSDSQFILKEVIRHLEGFWWEINHF
jgi:hypothetical protein